MGYYVKKLSLKCEDCRKYKYCELIEQLSNLEKELQNPIQISLLDFIVRKRADNLQESIDNLKRKIKTCLNRRAYVAVVKKHHCFRDQEYWEQQGLVSNCKKCYHYLPEYDLCSCGAETRNKRGFCLAYRYDIEKEDYEEFYEL